ncbi:MAG: heme A synthase [Deltaproteobacteria bacterium]|nr:heme A synthase [Deltaproteobacteria bacterium]
MTPSATLPPTERHAALERWLWTVYAMIFCMIIVGGVTRLTGSGLSMVEWRPLMDALPPLSDAEWTRVFDLYKRSPQYLQVNHWMELDDFKRIFFWEYIHRLLGRLIGLAFGLPWLYFSLKGALRGAWRWRALAALALGGAQGLLGWYMVKSGLVDRPEVSHLRLAAHLSLAFLCGAWVLSMLIDLREGARPHPAAHRPLRPSPALRPLLIGFAPLLALQIAYGAFMAGTRAGYLYSTFPTMNGAWVGPAVGQLAPWYHDALHNPDTIHTVHRLLAWVVLAWGLALSAALARASDALRAPARALAAALALQFTLGALTVLSGMNHAIAAAHQGGAFLLLSVALWGAQRWARAPR